MQLNYSKEVIISNEKVIDNIYLMKVKCDHNVKPGQFYMLKAGMGAPILPRPISINNAKDGVISFLYMVKGTGTEMIKNLENGDKVEVLGPLGNGFPMSELKGKVAVVAGGIGIAPMELVIDEMNADKIDVYVGFRNKSYGIDEMKKKANVFVSTETGEEGHRGYAIDNFNPGDYDVVISCGPEIMMKRLVNMCKESGTKCFVSMENHMACGVGACLVCTCKTKGGNKRACKDGPVFSGEDVIFDEQ